MTKNAKIITVLVAAILIIGGGYYLYKNKSDEAPEVQKQTQATTSPALNPISGQTISGKIPQTNPFQTSVNPYDSYKNPFNQK